MASSLKSFLILLAFITCQVATAQPRKKSAVKEDYIVVVGQKVGSLSVLNCELQLYKSILEKFCLRTLADTVKFEEVLIFDTGFAPMLLARGKEVNTGYRYYYGRELRKVGDEYQILSGTISHVCAPESCSDCEFSIDSAGHVMDCRNPLPTTSCPSGYCGYTYTATQGAMDFIRPCTLSPGKIGPEPINYMDL